jgi:hypothetical protein
MPCRIDQPGYVELMIDGAVYDNLPADFSPPAKLRQSVFPTFGRMVIDDIDYGDGLPDVTDGYDEFDATWQTADSSKDTAAALARLGTSGGTHELVWWKQAVFLYTLRAGQSLLYMPRVDAFTKQYVNFAGANCQAVIVPSWAAAALSYHAVVDATSAVTAGQVWIGNAAVLHPECGWTVTPFKLGTPPVATATLELRFYQVVRCSLSVDTTMRPGAEDKTLHGIEVR